MPKKINFLHFSFSAKLSLSLLALALVLFSFLFILIIPKMKQEQYDYKIKQIEQTISLNTQQLKLAVDFIITDGKTSARRIKNELNFEIYKIKEQIRTLNKDAINKILAQKEKQLQCSLNLIDNKNNLIFKEKEKLNLGEKSFLESKQTLNKWHVFTKNEEENFCPSITKYLVNSQEVSNNKLIISCNTKVFYDYQKSVEKKIKTYIQKSFSYTNNIHQGNTFLMWVNVKDATKDTPLYNKYDEKKNHKYCISKLSNVTSINTGTLSAKVILNASGGKPLTHTLNNKKALTWVRAINKDSKRRLIFITTVMEEDLYNNIDSIFRKLLPASLFALFFSVISGYFLFRKFSKNFDTLLKTSKQVRAGNLNFRSNIRGKDHIGVLGHTFDLMLDSMQNNIKNLDLKVQERTKQLQKSLDEKNTLLKEIHHRVKNNLAFTINLLKLQKRKVSDEKTKELLDDVQERIYTMELLHRKLYESKDLNSIPFQKYINELVEDITYAYNIKNLKLNIKIEDISMSIEKAMPCGLIINECITNAFKYAFNDDDNNFTILFQEKNNRYFLEIFDNGIGLPEDLDINKTKSLGLRLISSITKSQLQGNIIYKNDNGAKFLIDFPS